MKYIECRNGTTRPIVVMGISAGGFEALTKLIPQLEDLPAAIFIVQHLSPDYRSVLDMLLQKVTSLPVCFARDSMQIEQRRIYIAPPDFHLLLDDGVMRLSNGPRINYHRPAVDPLFFSAATVYQSCVVGVVLTGMLDDGAIGLAVIKRCGGVAVVQQPLDARYPDMPQSAIDADHPDFIVPLSTIADSIIKAVYLPKGPHREVDKELLHEVQFLKDPTAANDTAETSELTSISCPDCGGPMRKKTIADYYQYRCHVGHAYTGKWLLSAQKRVSEEVLWSAVRMLEERAQVERELAENERKAGHEGEAARLMKRAEESNDHARAVQELIMRK
jgi:two-component system chemotaxis response regulator CheB